MTVWIAIAGRRSHSNFIEQLAAIEGKIQSERARNQFGKVLDNLGAYAAFVDTFESGSIMELKRGLVGRFETHLRVKILKASFARLYI